MQQTFQCYRCDAQNYVGQPACWNCQSTFQWNCPNCKASVQNTMASCPYCHVVLPWTTQQPTQYIPYGPSYQQQQNIKSFNDHDENKKDLNFFQRHLNWTYLLWISAIYICGALIAIYINNANTSNTPIYAGGIWRWAIIPLVIFHIQANIWIIKRKGRSIWWFLPSVIFSPILLFLKNKSDEIGKTHLEIYLDKHGNAKELDGIRAMAAKQRELDELHGR